jgi:hypothetical protein
VSFKLSLGLTRSWFDKYSLSPLEIEQGVVVVCGWVGVGLLSGLYRQIIYVRMNDVRVSSRIQK